jgi:hypothetical protein
VSGPGRAGLQDVRGPGRCALEENLETPTGMSWQDAAATAPYFSLLEIDYAAYELLFAAVAAL